MSIFEFFSRITHPADKTGWIETEATFTGKSERAAKGRPGHYSPADYNEYQVRYLTAEGERFGWYVFHPLPDPEPDSVKGISIRIRYKENRPWEFEVIR